MKFTLWLVDTGYRVFGDVSMPKAHPTTDSGSWSIGSWIMEVLSDTCLHMCILCAFVFLVYCSNLRNWPGAFQPFVQRIRFLVVHLYLELFGNRFDFFPQMDVVDLKKANRAKHVRNTQRKTKPSHPKPRISVKTKSKKSKSCFSDLKSTAALLNQPESAPISDSNPSAMLDSIREAVAEVCKVPVKEKIYSRIEDLILFFLVAKDCPTVSSFLASCFTYLKTHCRDTSLSLLVMEHLTKMCGGTFTPQTGGVSVQDEQPAWLKSMKMIHTNWQLVVKNEGFQKISHVLSLCLSLGLCEASNFKFEIAGLNIFSLVVQPKHATALDLFSAVLDTVTFFIEGGYACYKAGSFKPLLYGSLDAQSFEELYQQCAECHENAIPGTMEKNCGVDGNTYEHMLMSCMDKAKQLMALGQSVPYQTVLRRKIDTIHAWQASYRQIRVNGGLRIAPYSVGIFGGSGVGKSTIAQILMVYILKRNGFECSDDYLCTLHEIDRYQSNYQAHMNGVFIDDIGNTKAQFVDNPSTNMIIKLKNNVKTYAVKAEIESKGKVSMEPMCLITTKNVKDAGASVFSNEPASICRRDDITITVTVRPEYSEYNMLSSQKIEKICGSGGPFIKDFWNIKVERAAPAPSQVKGAPASVAYHPVLDKNGKPMDSVSLPELIEYLRDATDEYFANQKQVVDDSIDVAGKMILCDACKLPADGVCKCCKTIPPSSDDSSASSDDSSISSKDSDDDSDNHFPLGQPYAVVAFESHMDTYYVYFNDEGKYTTTCTTKWYRGRSYVEKIPFTVPESANPIHYDNTERSKIYVNSYDSLDSLVDGLLPQRTDDCDSDDDDESDEESCSSDSTNQASNLSSDFSPEIGMVLAWSLYPFYAHCRGALYELWDRMWGDVEEYTTQQILDCLEGFETSPWFTWTNWLPSEVLQWQIIRDFTFFYHRGHLMTRCKRAITIHCMFIVFWLYLFWTTGSSSGSNVETGPSTSLVVTTVWYEQPKGIDSETIFSILLMGLMCFHVLCIHCALDAQKHILYRKIIDDNNAMPEFFNYYRDHHARWLIGTSAVILGIYGLVQTWKASRIVINAMDKKPQGNLAPDDDVEIAERDSETNPWAQSFTARMPCSDKSKTITPDQLEERAFSNLCYMIFECTTTGARHHCDAFFPKSNVAIIPKHSWVSNDLKAKFTRHSPTLIGGNFECYLCRDHSVDIPGTDFSLVWVPNGGDWKDLTDYLPLSAFGHVPARLIYKDSIGGRKRSRFTTRVEMTGHRATAFLGCEYELEWDHFNGLCMAPVITETKGPTIGAFHLGGSLSRKRRGCGGLLMRNQFDDAFARLSALPTLVLSKSEGTLPKEQYDVQYYQDGAIHPKSPVNFLPDGTNCKYYGQVIGRASYHSEVRPTIISKHVRDVCGVPQQWGGPKFRKGWPWQASLQHSTRPSCGVEGSLLDLAVVDYCDHIIYKLEKFPSLSRRVTPLSRMDTVCGQDGVRFIDKMPAGTSIGYPLVGPKRDYLTELDPAVYTSHNFPCEIDEKFWSEVERAEKLYLEGERAYPIFKACLKDEPTKLTKDKVRVFQGAPIALQLMIRMYFLPIARVFSMLPLDSECAVGVNAQGPEWDQLARHITKFGDDRILAGDYSKYDLRMPSQVIFAAFRIMIDIAEHCGYSERDISIMHGIATDVCYPLMAYNGDLIQHYGSNPSGQNLTVYINSIVNSLLLRSAYYHICGDKAPPFRDVCALITYGDDCKGSVKRGFDQFNHISVATFLRDRDMVFTMPDKTSDPTPYMHDSDADFLKRKNVYNPELDIMMGALDEQSIFKSLHATLQSKAITKEQAAAQNIDGGIREWFNHGREVYEKRRTEMTEIADRAGIAHVCTMLGQDYDTALQEWKDKYRPNRQD